MCQLFCSLFSLFINIRKSNSNQMKFKKKIIIGTMFETYLEAKRIKF